MTHSASVVILFDIGEEDLSAALGITDEAKQRFANLVRPW